MAIMERAIAAGADRLGGRLAEHRRLLARPRA
jgi:hypothetical protein